MRPLEESQVTLMSIIHLAKLEEEYDQQHRKRIHTY